MSSKNFEHCTHVNRVQYCLSLFLLSPVDKTKKQKLWVDSDG